MLKLRHVEISCQVACRRLAMLALKVFQAWKTRLGRTPPGQHCFGNVVGRPFAPGIAALVLFLS
jgi:hypothetical protein